MVMLVDARRVSVAARDGRNNKTHRTTVKVQRPFVVIFCGGHEQIDDMMEGQSNLTGAAACDCLAGQAARTGCLSENSKRTKRAEVLYLLPGER